jgi:peptidoglycan/LPS O-acetylase OafA/YrhL
MMVLLWHWWINVVPFPFFRKIPFGIGVNLFFVISGYLITTILMDARTRVKSGTSTNKKELLRFFYRRVLRIFPIYFIVAGIFVYFTKQDISKQIPFIFTHTVNIYMTFYEGVSGALIHFWSLGVEEQFYLLWPFLILLLPAKNDRGLIFIVILLSFICKLFFFYCTEFKGGVSCFPICSFDSLGAGALVAYLQYNKIIMYSFIKSRILLAVLLLGYFIIYVSGFFSSDLLNLTVGLYISALFATLVYIAANNGFIYFGKFLFENPVVVYLGKISYGIYIIHGFCNPLFFDGGFARYFPWAKNDLQFYNAYFITTVVFATISWFLIERPILNLKYKLLN